MINFTLCVFYCACTHIHTHKDRQKEKKIHGTWVREGPEDVIPLFIKALAFPMAKFSSRSRTTN